MGVVCLTWIPNLAPVRHTARCSYDKDDIVSACYVTNNGQEHKLIQRAVDQTDVLRFVARWAISFMRTGDIVL